MYFSFIIPVYNRPDEIDELLKSLTEQTYQSDFEVVVVEDGSTIPCEQVIDSYRDKLSVSYYNKPNSGPGDSRNFGMRMAKGEYFLILDSDCILPAGYLSSVDSSLKEEYVDCFGGPDSALDSFSDVQKAINFTMTSFLTTGGIRGGSEKIGRFQPRSFNMGLSRKGFEASGGFGNIHPGEDPDLSIRLWEMGFDSKLVKNAYVYHKRRIDWSKFYKQVNKFGKARPILDAWYPKYKKVTFWFPTVFCLGFIVSLVLGIVVSPLFLLAYPLYFAILFVSGVVKTGSLKIGALAVIACVIQFYGYGIGFLKSVLKIAVLKQKPEVAFPELFFKK